MVGTDAVMGRAQISFHSALCFGCFSHQIYTLLFATGNLERGDVCNLWAAETGLDERPDATGISVLNRSGHLDATGTKSVKNGIKQWVHAHGHRPTHVYRAVYLLMTQEPKGEEEEGIWSSVCCLFFFPFFSSSFFFSVCCLNVFVLHW